jgi:hypothetical protein
MKDLFHQDVVEMIERETRQFQMWEIMDPSDPLFPTAYETLWNAFGPQGEMEREEAIKSFLVEDPFDPTDSGTYIRYFLMAARDKNGKLCGVRDGSVLINPSYAPDLCVIYLSHIYMFPEARGTVLSYWLRIAPVEVAIQYLLDLHQRGKIVLPAPDRPGKNFGMRLDLCAEMEYFTPEDRVSWQRVLFYGRGGFDVINPRHFPYLQPDFRDPDVIRQTGNRPLPFMMLVRRMGNERQATMSIGEATGLIRLMYDDFQTHCAPEHLEGSLTHVMKHLAERAKTKHFVELLPLPSGPKDLHRFKRISRYNIYSRNYQGTSPEVTDYLEQIKPILAANPKYFDEHLSKIQAELEKRPHYVYGNREKGFTFYGEKEPDEPPETPESRGEVDSDLTAELSYPDLTR